MKERLIRLNMAQGAQIPTVAADPTIHERQRVRLALQAENAALRHQVVNLALEI